MISKIQMQNCQSWRDGTIELATDKLNVIAADNGVGKSVLFKMLKITSDPNYFNRAERKDLIRRHEEYARILFEFDDGGLAATTVYPTYTLYLYKPADSETVQTSYEPPTEMLRQLELLTDGVTPFIANLVDADQDLLLVNSRTKYNYNLIKMLVEHADLEKVREVIQEATVAVANPLTSLTKKCTFLENKIAQSEYFDIAAKELQIKKLEKSKDVLMQLIDLYNTMEALRGAIEYDKDFDKLEVYMQILEHVSDLDLSSLKVLDNPPNVSASLDVLEILENINLQDLKVLKQAPEADDALKLLECISQLELGDLAILKDVGYCEPALDILQGLEDLHAAISLLRQHEDLADNAKNDISELYDELLQSGEMVSCGVHGKVIYNGQECIPYSN